MPVTARLDTVYLFDVSTGGAVPCWLMTGQIQGLALRWLCLGGLVEWSITLVLKTSEVKASVGSNPTPAASKTVGLWPGVRGIPD